jgi:mono/diheme cytochrome c family protein
MRFKCFTAGIAVLLVFGIWQMGAGQAPGVKRKSGPTTAQLRKRGAYLVKEVAHCNHCHTPRDAKGEPDRSKLLQGATLPIAPKKMTDQWADMSPDITSTGLAGKWGEKDFIKFLKTGIDPHGEKPMPPMPVFHLKTSDARAVFLYLKSLPGSKAGGGGKKKERDEG